ncbi:transglutaminase-like cysteine peptidase [Vibrio tritonius]|uniref:transglutaminase-like cysteine peptidase n=1 Tax=Vibrio tritonius TaxID=1435069 RepID=UPI0008398024|nr:transglutaminase-like cysteine peptidase [Vibrio tritonius]
MLRWLIVIFITILPLGSIALTTKEQQWVNTVTTIYGTRAGMRVEAWRKEVKQSTNLADKQKLTNINRFFNQLYFVNDIVLWGKKDYWATPLEFLGSNAGDCEDFTIAKYFSLRELGIPDEKMRLVYVKAIELNQFHMVLAYYETPNSQPLILDNIDKRILPASKRPDLLPIYSFNGSKLWLMKTKNGQLAGNSSKLSVWNDLRAREQSQKLNKPIVNYDE